MANQVRWSLAVLGVVVLEVVMVGAAFGWVAVYSHLIAPGRSMAEYEAYAEMASPVVSLIAGVPAFWIAGASLRRRLAAEAIPSAAAMATLYLALDVLLIVAMTEGPDYSWLMVLPSWLTKVLAAYFGARTPRAHGGVAGAS
jgi:hypothetical protein